MRIDIGMAEEGVDPIDQQITDGVLHVLGLVVHLVPAHVERAEQKEFDEPMPPDHPQCQHAAGPRQGHALVGLVRRQPRSVERLEHARDRAGGDVERRGDLPGAGRLPRLGGRDLIDRLDVVLDGQAWHGTLLLAPAVSHAQKKEKGASHQIWERYTRAAYPHSPYLVAGTFF